MSVASATTPASATTEAVVPWANPNRASVSQTTVASAVDPQGRVVTVRIESDPLHGYQCPDGTMQQDGHRIELVRYLADGSADASFGLGGRAIVDTSGTWLAPITGLYVYSFSLDSQARPIIRVSWNPTVWCTDGHLMSAADSGMALVRLSPSGSLDATFGSQGILDLTSPDNRFFTGSGIQRQVGDATVVATGHAALRVDATGVRSVTLDGANSVNVHSVTSIGNVLSFGADVSIAFGGASDNAAARVYVYDASSDLTPAIGATGYLDLTSPALVQPPGYDPAEYLMQTRSFVSADPEGRIIVAAVGSWNTNTPMMTRMEAYTRTVALWRLVSVDGTWVVDPGFGTGGTATLPIPTGGDTWNVDLLDMITDSQSRVLLMTRNDTTASVLRLQPSGDIDPTYGVGGQAVVLRGLNRWTPPSRTSLMVDDRDRAYTSLNETVVVPNTAVAHTLQAGHVAAATAITRSPNPDGIRRLTVAGELDPSWLGNPAAPSAPITVAAATRNRGAVVTWQPPADPGSSAVTSYTVSSAPGDFHCTSTTATTCAVVGLRNGATYRFSVTATSNDGTGPTSAPSNVVVVGTPTVPLRVVSSPRNGSALVAWSTPASRGSGPILRYVVTATPSGRRCTATSLSCTVTGLRNKVAYRFVVRATNASGTSPASSPTLTVTVGTPTKPRAVRVTVHSGTALATWATPAFTGSGRVVGFQTRWSTDAGTSWSTWTRPARAIGATHAKLGHRRAVVMQVRALNNSGAGEIAAVRFTGPA